MFTQVKTRGKIQLVYYFSCSEHCAPVKIADICIGFVLTQLQTNQMNLHPMEIPGIYPQLAVRIFFFLCASKINFFSFYAKLLIYPYKTKSL